MPCAKPYGFGKPRRLPHVPHLIALCGFPKSGKSEVQRILSTRYGVHPVDDGYALREFAQKHLGLSHDDVYTQEGKTRSTEILGKSWQNRDILGSTGAVLENLFGDHIMPWMATRGLDPEQSYSFGSVRKTQGHFFKKRGGIVIAINNPIVEASPYCFDQFDESAVDYWIQNDGQARQLPREESLADLARKVIDVIESRILFREAGE